MASKDYSKELDLLPIDKPFLAKDVGLTGATLSAMCKRGLIRKINTSSPYKYQRDKNMNSGYDFLLKVSKVNKETNLNQKYWTVSFKNQIVPILCTFADGKLLDYNGKNITYKANDIVLIEFYEEGKKVLSFSNESI